MSIRLYYATATTTGILMTVGTCALHNDTFLSDRIQFEVGSDSSVRKCTSSALLPIVQKLLIRLALGHGIPTRTPINYKSQLGRCKRVRKDSQLDDMRRDRQEIYWKNFDSGSGFPLSKSAL